MNLKENLLTSAISAKGVLSHHIANVENSIVNVLKMKMQNICEEFIQNSKILEKIIKEMREISIKAVNNEK